MVKQFQLVVRQSISTNTHDGFTLVRFLFGVEGK